MLEKILIAMMISGTVVISLPEYSVFKDTACSTTNKIISQSQQRDEYLKLYGYEIHTFTGSQIEDNYAKCSKSIEELIQQ